MALRQEPTSKILIADDDQTLVRTLTWILKEHGFEVCTLDSGEELVRRLEVEQPDLLLLDIMMPRVDGLSLLERLKGDERWREMPILMISSMPPEEATVRSLGLGASDFIPKPFRVRELVARVRAHVRAARELRATREELRSAREEAQSSTQLAEILRDITDTLKPDEIYHILTRRVARVLNVARCSVVLAQPGDPEGMVVAAYESPMLRNLRVSLDRYPEIQRALETGALVLVEDVQQDPLYEEVRRRWAAEGVAVTTRSCLAIPFAVHERQRGVFLLRTTGEAPPLTRADGEFAESVVRAAVAALEKAHSLETAVAARDHLQQLAAVDPLTGCANRRVLVETLDAELERARRYGVNVTVLLADLDRFKLVNDTYGHLAGDNVLRQVGELLKQEVRSTDIVARYGGEEFVVVMPQTTAEGGMIFAERIRARVADHDFGAPGGEPLRLTVSIGVASYPDDRVTDPESFVALADRALYRAKHGGRNVVRDLGLT